MKKWIEVGIILMCLAAFVACAKPMHDLSRSKASPAARGKNTIMLETKGFDNDWKQPCGNDMLSQALFDQKPLVDLNAFFRQ